MLAINLLLDHYSHLLTSFCYKGNSYFQKTHIQSFMNLKKPYIKTKRKFVFA